MKRWGKGLVLLVLLGGCALYLFYPRLRAPHIYSPFEAAQMLEDEAESNGGGIVFRTEEIDLDEVYAALEARYPYAFALHAVTRMGGTVELRVEVSRAARQQQAWNYAQLLAGQTASVGMDDAQKLYALHDALVRLCSYDEQTAEKADYDGATAPFAADGALLDHKAVCSGYGRAFVMLCRAAGLRAVYVASEEMNHGWNAVRLDDRTYYIDCTFDDPVPDRGEYVSHEYFLLTDTELAVSHRWDKNFYEQALDSLN